MHDVTTANSMRQTCVNLLNLKYWDTGRRDAANTSHILSYVMHYERKLSRALVQKYDGMLVCTMPVEMYL